jgi:3-oxoacyl-[acyl-carrier protein] reductase
MRLRAGTGPGQTAWAETMNTSYSNICCVVTGGSNGIGRAIVQDLAEKGATVINVDRELPDWSLDRVHHYQADLTNAHDTARVAHDISQRHQVTALVNNVGATRPGSVSGATAEDLRVVTALHIETPFTLVQAFLPTINGCGYGRIVNISSRAALGKHDRLVYSTTKAGMVGMMRTLAMELGEHGVTVNAIGPGPIDTELFRRSNPAGSPLTQRIIDSVAVKRLGQPEDVARMVSFLIAPENGFITGQMIYVCGGTTLGVAPA